MTDIVCEEARSRMMSGIRAKDTKLEMTVRKGLHRMGLRYVLHDKRLPGKPDMVFPKYKAVILINGCFWHGHECPLFKWPLTRSDFWRDKITGTRERDRRNIELYAGLGWRVLVLWECALKGSQKRNYGGVLEELACWLKNGHGYREVKGQARGRLSSSVMANLVETQLL